jgi:hypothetical protein
MQGLMQSHRQSLGQEPYTMQTDADAVLIGRTTNPMIKSSKSLCYLDRLPLLPLLFRLTVLTILFCCFDCSVLLFQLFRSAVTAVPFIVLVILSLPLLSVL